MSKGKWRFESGTIHYRDVDKAFGAAMKAAGYQRRPAQRDRTVIRPMRFLPSDDIRYGASVAWACAELGGN